MSRAHDGTDLRPETDHQPTAGMTPFRAAAPLGEVHRLTAFLDAVATGSLDYALAMAGNGPRPTGRPPAPSSPGAVSGSQPGALDAARALARSPAGEESALASALSRLGSDTPAEIVASLSGKTRARTFLEIVATSASRTSKPNEREACTALEMALLERGFPVDAATARLAVLHVAQGASPYSHGAGRAWLRVHGRYGFLRDIAHAVRRGLVLDAGTRGALGEIARRLRASGTPASRKAERALERTLALLDNLTRGAPAKPCDLPPGFHASLNLDLYTPAEHAFFDAVLGALEAAPKDTSEPWLTLEKAQAVRKAAAAVAGSLPYLWDRDRLPEAHRLDCEGRDPPGRLLAHMTSFASPRPANAWRLAAARLANEIGADAVRRSLLGWTGLLLHSKATLEDWAPLHRANALGRMMLWSRIPEHVQTLSDTGKVMPGSEAYNAAVAHAVEAGIAKRTLLDHVDGARGNPFDDMSTPFLAIGAACLPAVRGALWMLSLYPDDEVSAHLEKVALALLEKRHGEFRSLAAANAAIGALGAIGTGTALDALKRIRQKVAEAPVAAATARALTVDHEPAGRTRSAVTRLKRP